MKALALVVLLVVACHKPQRKSFGKTLAAMRNRIASAVKLDVKAKVDAKALVAPSPAPAAHRVREEEPPPQAAPPPATSSPPPVVHVDRVDASRPSVFVLRGERHDGSAFCEAHTTMSACNTACTAMLRPNMFGKAEPSTPKHCACTELDRGC